LILIHELQLLEARPAIPIINMRGNTPTLHVEQIEHCTSLPDYPQTRIGGYAYIIGLEGMTELHIEALKNDVNINIFIRAF
jgi:hypothetical protein